MSAPLGNIIAACFALAAFVVAVIAGLSADLSAASILARALIAMVVCYPGGLIIGSMCQRVVNAQILAEIEANHLNDAAAARENVSAMEEEAIVV